MLGLQNVSIPRSSVKAVSKMYGSLLRPSRRRRSVRRMVRRRRR